MVKKHKQYINKLLFIFILGCNFFQQSFAEDFTFNVPINFSLTCNKSMEIYATCAVYKIAMPADVWPVENGDGWLMYQEGQSYAQLGDTIGGNRPAFDEQGAGDYVKVVYPGNGAPVVTQLQVKFNAHPIHDPNDAAYWRCWTLMVPTEWTNFNMFVIPGSADQYTEGYEEKNCYYGTNVTVVQEGTFPTN